VEGPLQEKVSILKQQNPNVASLLGSVFCAGSPVHVLISSSCVTIRISGFETREAYMFFLLDFSVGVRVKDVT
jgi:hypothetical protein